MTIVRSPFHTSPEYMDNSDPWTLGNWDSEDAGDAAIPPMLARDRHLRRWFSTLLEAAIIIDQTGLIVAANAVAMQMLSGLACNTSITDWIITPLDFNTLIQIISVPNSSPLSLIVGQAHQASYEVQLTGIADWYDHWHLILFTPQLGISPPSQKLTASQEERIGQRIAELCQMNAALSAANRQLQISQQKYQTLFQILPIGVSITDQDGHIIEVNPASEKILGITIQEHIHRNFDSSSWTILYPDGRKMPTEDWAGVRALREQRPVLAVQKGVQHTDGTVRWLMVSAAPLPISHHGVAITYVDITEHVCTQTALQHSEAKTRAILAAIPDLMFRVGQDGYYREVVTSHHELEEFFGHRNPVGQSMAQFLPPDMVQRQLQAIQRVIQDGQLYVYEQALPVQPQQPRYEEVRVVRSGADEVLFMIRDITDRKIAEAALEAQERKFRTLAENSPDLIMRCDRQYRFLYVNPAVVALTNLPGAAYIGRRAEDLGFPDTLTTLWNDNAEAVFQTGIERSLEYEISLPQDTLTLSSRIVPEQNADGSINSILIVARDITDMKRAQQALQQQADRERLLGLMTQKMRHSLDLPQILDTVVVELRQILHVDRLLICRLTAAGQGTVLAESVRRPELSILDASVDHLGLSVQWLNHYRRGGITVLDDIHRDRDTLSSFHQHLFTQLHVHANLAVPITDGSTLWGLVCAQYCSEAHPWQPDEIELIQRVAAQLAIAVQQSELHSQLQQWAIDLECQVQARTAEIQKALEFEATLKRITDLVRDSLDESNILETVVQELGVQLQLLCCDTGIYNADYTTSTITHEFTQSLKSIKGQTFKITEATHADLYPLILAGTTVQFCDCTPFALRPDRQYSTVLVCAIRDDQAMLGDIWLVKPYGQIFTELEVRLVEQVANQCAIALRQARLFQASQTQVLELERLNRLKDDFLSTVSHELRTPLSSIKMATEMLEFRLRSLGLLPTPTAPDKPQEENQLQPLVASQHQDVAQIKNYITILKDEGAREIALINDLLDLTRLEAQTEPVHPVTMSLQLWVPACLEAQLSLIQQRHQTLTLAIPPELPPLTLDFFYLQKILLELVRNACKYTPPHGTITITAALQPSSALAEMLELRIGNSGVEIAETERDRIFERFYRIPNHDPWKYDGTGLGLALVRKRVEYLGGQITVSSSKDYTEFQLRIPVMASRAS